MSSNKNIFGKNLYSQLLFYIQQLNQVVISEPQLYSVFDSVYFIPVFQRISL